ncbi:MAG: YCF48-related protein [Cytophagaceae bacterium]
MKKGFTILAIILLSGFSGFCYTTAGGTSQDTIIVVPSGVKAYLTAVAFADQYTGIIVGDSGRILKTNDGGKSWRIINSPVKIWLSAVQFPTAKVGYIVGDSGTILKSVNSGETWVKLASPANDRLLGSISFLDANNGYVGGGSARSYYKTKDGGLTWKETSLDNKFSASLAFTDTATGYLFETFLWLGKPCWPINKTTDGGKTWTNVSCAEMNVHKFKLAYGNTGFALASNALYKVNDGMISNSVSSTEGMTDFSFSDSKNGFLVGDTILKTANGGNSWSILKEAPSTLSAVYALGKDEAIAVGPQGMIVHITTKQTIQVQTTTALNDLAAGNETAGLKIYPNPFTDTFVMNFSTSEVRTMKIYNHFGQELQSLSMEGNEGAVSMGNLPAGVYYLNIHSQKGKSTHKIIKE